MLLFIDAIGLRPQIEAMADRMASWGYVVLAPNVFFRTGSAAALAPTVDLRVPGEREAFISTIGPRMQELTPELIHSDITDYLAALRGLSGVGSGPIGVTGYCMGSRLSMYAAGDHPDDVAAAAGFHGGRLVTEDADSPHRALATARAEFVFGHADNDASMTPEDVAALGEALAAHGLTATNEIYPDAPHGYTMADTSMYQAEGAERAFRELEALFARTLRG